jgi:hypothetical protein
LSVVCSKIAVVLLKGNNYGAFAIAETHIFHRRRLKRGYLGLADAFGRIDGLGAYDQF